MLVSVLDQSPAAVGRSQGESIRSTLQLGRTCETLGYHRFWVSEHHNSGTIVGTAPEILVAALAATTQTIRIGSAGVLLPHYSPLKVAEQFRVIEALAPGRVDLGVGRAPGSDGRTAYALNPHGMSAGVDSFPADVRDLIAWVSGAPLIEGHAFADIEALPLGDTSPDVWMLGSSDYGAQLAAYLGLPYCYAYFFSDGHGAGHALDLYRQLYRPSQRYPQPYATIAIWALAADTEAEAQRLFMSRARTRILRDRGGMREPLLSPEDAAAGPFTASEWSRIDAMRRDSLIGTGPEVAARIERLAAQFGVQEVTIVTWTWDFAARTRSFELLAEAFGLGGAAPGDPASTRAAGTPA